MTLEQKIGQCLVGGFPSTEMSEEFINAVKKYKIGNVILFRENVKDLEQLKKLCEDIQILMMEETGHPAFITIDQEGGVVARLPESAANIPGAMAMAATGKPENVYEAGLLTGRELRSLGVNFDLAPTLDVNNNPKNPIIGARSYGDTPEKVSEFGVEMIKGLVDGGVLASAKHFPGHGDTDADSHVSLPCVNKSIEELEKMELYPFKKAIEAEVPAITTTHILFPQIEEEKIPATMSRKIITGLLREKMGFNGLVISDCMQMSAINKYYGTVNGVIEAMKAGVDLIFVSHSVEMITEAAVLAKEKIENGEMSLDELNISVERIKLYKEKFDIGHTPITDFDMEDAVAVCDRLRHETITEVQLPKDKFEMGDIPFCLGCPAFNTGLVGNVVEDVRSTFAEILAPLINGVALPTAVDPTDEEITSVLNQAKSHSSIIMGTYNGHLHPQQMKLMHELTKLDIPMTVVALRNPYDLRDLPETVYAIEAYEYTTPVVEIIAEVLLGKFKPTGKLPVKL